MGGADSLQVASLPGIRLVQFTDFPLQCSMSQSSLSLVSCYPPSQQFNGCERCSRTALHCTELFTWVTGRPVTTEQAMKCAKREPGRSWEAIDSELAKLGQSSVQPPPGVHS